MVIRVRRDAPTRRWEPATWDMGGGRERDRGWIGGDAGIFNSGGRQDTGSGFEFPVGTPESGEANEAPDVVPVIHETTDPGPQSSFPPAAAGTNSPQDEIFVPHRPDESGTARMVAVSWFDYWKRIATEPNLLPPDYGGVPDPEYLQTVINEIPDGTITDDGTVYGTTTTEDPDMGWISDAYDYIDENYAGGYLPGGTAPGGGGPNYNQTPGGGVVTGGGGGGVIVPPVVVPGAGGMPGCGGGGAQPVFKRVCGVYKWVYPKRRRRKALATKGDLSDLAALKGILGGGKAFEVWIATHS